MVTRRLQRAVATSIFLNKTRGDTGKSQPKRPAQKRKRLLRPRRRPPRRCGPARRGSAAAARTCPGSVGTRGEMGPRPTPTPAPETHLHQRVLRRKEWQGNHSHSMPSLLELVEGDLPQANSSQPAEAAAAAARGGQELLAEHLRVGAQPNELVRVAALRLDQRRVFPALEHPRLRKGRDPLQVAREGLDQLVAQLLEAAPHSELRPPDRGDSSGRRQGGSLGDLLLDRPLLAAGADGDVEVAPRHRLGYRDLILHDRLAGRRGRRVEGAWQELPARGTRAAREIQRPSVGHPSNQRHPRPAYPTRNSAPPAAAPKAPPWRHYTRRGNARAQATSDGRACWTD